MSAEDGASVPEPEKLQPEDANPTGDESQTIAVPQEHEEKPVIDVHAPHGGLHTWKDFWIHLGTIALGLLIAISLEQSVEWLHHLHQRHQLEADLHAEAEVDHGAVSGTLRRFVVMRSWLLAMRDEADRKHDSGGKPKLAYIPQPVIDPETNARLPMRLIPSDAVWATAKESDLVALLPREEGEVYSRHDLAHELLVDSMKAYYESQNALKAFEVRFEQSGGNQEKPDMALMTGPELEEYSRLLSSEIAAMDYATYRLTFYDAETEALLNGARTEREMLQHVAQREIDQN